MNLAIRLIFSAIIFCGGVLSLGIGLANTYPALTYSPPKRVSLFEANNFEGTSAEFFSEYSKRESLLDAVEAKYEAECIKQVQGAK